MNRPVVNGKRGFFEGFAEGRMCVADAGNVFGAAAVFHDGHRFGNHVAGARPENMNAKHAVGDRGIIRLSTDYNKHIQKAIIRIADTGHGIEKKNVSKIFDPFFTTKPPGEGTGLGLSVSYGIVKSHGGAITVSSEPGKGSIFKAFLPLIEKEVAEDNSVDKTILTGNESVLFVDDEQALVNMGKLMLEHLGYKVDACTDSLEALEKFKAQPDKFDLAICDMTMPKMTGTDLAVKLREIRSDLPIILCTGYNANISELNAKKMGINAFVLKPIAMDKLGKLIRTVIDKQESL